MNSLSQRGGRAPSPRPAARIESDGRSFKLPSAHPVAESYPPTGTAVNDLQAPLRAHSANFSATRPPSNSRDAALWPAWTRVPITKAGIVLLHEDGTPVGVGGGN